MSLLAELKRRNVFKVGVTYAIVAWLLIQVIDTVLPRLGAPEWFVTALMVLLMLGFPVALVLAWAFEFTPEGIKKQQIADAAGQHSSGSKLNVVLIGALVLAVLFMAVDNYLLDDTAPAPLQAELATEGSADGTVDAATDVATETAPTAAGALVFDIPEKSLAVLPFADLSPDSDQEYFSDGLSEELLNKLAQVDGLLVTARSSSFYYKGRNEDMRTIGQQLGVSYILEGSVRKAGNQLRITAQLIQADNGFHLWSDTYDRELADIFELQDELATAVTTALSITLGTGEFDLPGMTRNVDAYDEALKALNDVQLLTQASVRSAIDHIERAVSLDPEFYAGWGMLDGIYNAALILFPPDQTEEFVNRRAYARQLLLEQAGELPATRAFAINDLVEAGNFAEAEQLAQQLIADTGENNSPYSTIYAFLLSTVGRNRDAITWWQTARRVNPLDPTVSINFHRALLSLNRVGEARVEIERGLTRASGTVAEALRRGYWLAALQEGDIEEARAAWLAAMGDPVPDSLEDFWLKGDNESGLQVIRDGLGNENLSRIFLSSQDQFAMALGDAQLALDIRRRSGNFSTMWMDYAAEMRKLPDFKLFVEEQGLLDYWRSTGNWADKCRPVNDTFGCE